MIRDDQVRALINAVGSLGGLDFEMIMELSNAEEIDAAVRKLRNAALAQPRDVLSLNLWEVATAAGRGRCLEWVGEQFPGWRSWPDRSLADMLKTAEPWRVAQVRDALRRAGLDIDLGEMGQFDDDCITDDAS